MCTQNYYQGSEIKVDKARSLVEAQELLRRPRSPIRYLYKYRGVDEQHYADIYLRSKISA